MKRINKDTESYDVEIKRLKDGLEKAKNLRIQAETRLEELVKQEKDIIGQIRSLGVEPEDLEEEIENCRKEIERLIKEVEEAIPWEILRKQG